jgi:hypothetical protein
VWLNVSSSVICAYFSKAVSNSLVSPEVSISVLEARRLPCGDETGASRN